MSKVPTPSANDLHIAAQWLDIYEGAEDAEACHRVSKWLRSQSDAKELRDMAKEMNVPVSKVRAAVKQSASGKN